MSSQTVRIGSDKWRFEIWMLESDWELLKFYRNGKLIQSLPSEEMGNVMKTDYCGQYFTVRLMHFPTPYPVIMTRVHSGAGHGQITRFYAVKRRQLFIMGEVDAECGGPVFRDIDKDGTREWIFDDFDPHIYHDDGPEFYEVYKENREGKLVFWKKLPNKKRQHLPDPLAQ